MQLARPVLAQQPEGFEADGWPDRNFASLGKRETVKLAAICP